TLAEVVDSLPDTVALREPRPALRDRLLQAATTEARSRVAAGSRRWSFGPIRPWRLAIAAVTAVVIVLGAADVDAYRRLVAVTADGSPWGTHGVVVMESRIAPPTSVP